MGSEIAAVVTEQAFDDLDAPVERVTGANAPMPYARNLERLKTPSKERIVDAVRRVCYANGRLSHGRHQGRHAQALRGDGERQDHQVAQEGRATAIQGGDILAEVETDKADVEMEAFGAGVLRKILVPAGATAPVGTLIGVIAEPGEDIRLSSLPRPPGPEARQAPELRKHHFARSLPRLRPRRARRRRFLRRLARQR